MAKEQTEQSNASSEVWAEALAQYEADKGVLDRARGVIQKHAKYYEDAGIPAKAIRARYAEAQLTDDERAQLYAEEQISRRALDLWNASSADDFNRLIERAAETMPAVGAGASKLDGVRAYNDGFNSARHGKATMDDNPKQPGTPEHQQWAHGCSDGIDYNVNLAGNPMVRSADPAPRQASAMEEQGAAAETERVPATKKKAGRPRKQSAIDHLAVNAAKLNGDHAPEDEVPAGGLFADDVSEMPAVPGMPV